MRVSSGDYFSKTNGPRSGATKYGILNESKLMAYLNIFFEKGTVSGSGTGPLDYGSGTGPRATPMRTVSGSGSL